MEQGPFALDFDAELSPRGPERYSFPVVLPQAVIAPGWDDGEVLRLGYFVDVWVPRGAVEAGFDTVDDCCGLEAVLSPFFSGKELEVADGS